MTDLLAQLDQPSRPGRAPHYTNHKHPRYLLRLPGEPKAKGRTRATTLVKAIEDASSLIDWHSCMSIIGALTDTRTRAEWAALLANSGGDPWYHSDETKARCRELVEQSKDAGGGNDRRDLGTALHGVLEAVVTGRANASDVLEEFRPFVTNALDIIYRAGLEPVPELCERSVYVERFDVVGRFDLILRRRTDGALIIGDWKTGGQTWKPKNNWKTKRQEGWRDGYADSDLGHSAQMALYAMADHFIEWPEDQWDECTLLSFPDVSQETALILHVPSTEAGQVSIRYLDLNIGRQAIETAALVRDIRKANPLKARIGTTEPPWPPRAAA